MCKTALRQNSLTQAGSRAEEAAAAAICEGNFAEICLCSWKHFRISSNMLPPISCLTLNFNRPQETVLILINSSTLNSACYTVGLQNMLDGSPVRQPSAFTLHVWKVTTVLNVEFYGGLEDSRLVGFS